MDYGHQVRAIAGKLILMLLSARTSVQSAVGRLAQTVPDANVRKHDGALALLKLASLCVRAWQINRMVNELEDAYVAFSLTNVVGYHTRLWYNLYVFRRAARRSKFSRRRAYNEDKVPYQLQLSFASANPAECLRTSTRSTNAMLCITAKLHVLL